MYTGRVSMSLTGRVALLVLLALIGLGAATTAILRAHQESDAVREAQAASQADALSRQLLARRDELPSSLVAAIAAGHPGPPALRSTVAALLMPLLDASAGYCLSDGTLVVRETVAPHSEMSAPLPGQRTKIAHELGHGGSGPRRGVLLPLDRDVVVAACRTRGAQSRVRFAAPNDILFVSLAGTKDSLAAWALVRTPKRVHSSAAIAVPYLVFAMAFSMIALVALCVDTVLRIRSGTRAIECALVAAQTNLETVIPQPSTRELAQIADRLRAMTAHLAQARDRELALERRLSHERRLASLGRVAAGISHEIRNPLAGIKLRLDTMARRGLDDRNAHDVMRSLEEVARLDAVVSSLLLVARKEPAALVDVDLTALVDERIAALESFAATRAVRVVRRGAARAHVDPIGIARVIDNLARNGIEASPQGAEVELVLAVERGDVVFDVVDRGPGVMADIEAELFEPFFTSKPSGTGLGLSLSRATVESHGGTLSYRRGIDATSFCVRLPGKAIA